MLVSSTAKVDLRSRKPTSVTLPMFWAVCQVFFLVIWAGIPINISLSRENHLHFACNRPEYQPGSCQNAQRATQPLNREGVMQNSQKH